MADPVDKATPIARFKSPVTQEGFVAIPTVIVLRSDLTPQAKLVYGYLGHCAWRGRTSEIATAREQVAADLNMGAKAVTGYIKELRDAPAAEGDPNPDSPRLLESVRRGLGLTNVYLLNDPLEGHSGKVESTSLERSGGPILPSSKKKNTKKDPPTPQPVNAPEGAITNPPPIVLIDGRNLPLDALLTACGIQAAVTNKRVTEAVAALNGRTTARTFTPGIRHAYWEECYRFADDADNRDMIAAMIVNPEMFAAKLAYRIGVKAERYAAAMPGAALTPTALLKWWHDLVPARDATTRLTPAEIRSMANDG